MDMFVRDQLRSVGCGTFVPIFMAEGYREASYRQIRLETLTQIITNDDNAIESIWSNIQSLQNAPPADPDPVPTLPTRKSLPRRCKLKQRQIRPNTNTASDQYDDSAYESTYYGSDKKRKRSDENEEEDADEVVIHEKIAGQSGVTPPMEVEEEKSGSESTSENENEPTPAISSTDSNGLYGVKADPIGKVNGEAQNGSSGSISRFRRSHFDYEQHSKNQSNPKLRRICEEWARVHQLLTSSRIQGFMWSAKSSALSFECSSIVQFKKIMGFLEINAIQLSHVLNSLKLTTNNKDLNVTNTRFGRFTHLPHVLFNDLTTLVLDVDLVKFTKYKLITILLSKCSNLQHLDFRRGVQVEGYIKIPVMTKLVSFRFAWDFNIQGMCYKRPPIGMVDVESDNYEKAGQTVKFKIDFGYRKFPELETLQVGPFHDLNFRNLAQFPKLTEFIPLNTLEDFSADCDRMYEEVVCSAVDPGCSEQLITRTRYMFPNLTGLVLTLPSVGILGTFIKVMADSLLTDLNIMVSYEFESALSTVLRGLPYKLITKNDKSKLKRMRRYKHWKTFANLLKIDIPSEEFLDDRSNGETEVGRNSEDTEVVSVGIGSFRHLEVLEIRFLAGKIHIPTNNLHWNNPEVEVSSERWSSRALHFPTCILLDELTKLNGTLKDLNIPDFIVDEDAATKFENIMGFRIRYDECALSKNADWFNGTDFHDGRPRAVKQEEDS